MFGTAGTDVPGAETRATICWVAVLPAGPVRIFATSFGSAQVGHAGDELGVRIATDTNWLLSTLLVTLGGAVMVS
jgi:hypothetical protein